MVQLTDELVQLLDRRAERQGTSRSQVVREAVEAYLAEDREAALDRTIQEGYRRRPQAGEFDEDEWGDLAGLTTALATEMLRQVAAEEQGAGDEPW
jgi:predicted transcriptional regulator